MQDEREPAESSRKSEDGSEDPEAFIDLGEAEETANKVSDQNESQESASSNIQEDSYVGSSDIESIATTSNELQEMLPLETSIMEYPAKAGSNGPEKPGWKPECKGIPTKPAKFVNAIGDLHGWAPGLITYLISNQLAKIEINDLPLFIEDSGEDATILKIHEDNMKKIFPTPLEYRNNHDQFMFTGLQDFSSDESRNVEVNEESTSAGFHSIKAEWIASDDVVFIQVGDILDRGDYGELAMEILRQLIIQAPFRVFVLIGNHEQIYIENDYNTWIYNEQVFDYDPEKLNQKGFHTLFKQNFLMEPSDDELIKKKIFKRGQIACALLYLTQHCAQAKFLENIFPEIKDSFNIDKDQILNGGWTAYSQAEEYFEGFKKSRASGFPGTLISVGIGHSLFIHAEPKAFAEVNIDEFGRRIFEVSEQPCIDMLFSLYRPTSSAGNLDSSPDFPCLWSRGGAEGSSMAEPHPAAAEYIAPLIKILPGTRHIIHGHTPTINNKSFVDLEGNYPVTYLARNFGEALSTKTGSVRIHNIDEGICPVYQIGDHEQIFDPCRVPFGLKVDDELLQFQGRNTTQLEKNASDWKRVIRESAILRPFEVPEQLILKEKTDIGNFGPGCVFWPTNLEADINFSGNRFSFPESSIFKEYRLFRVSSRYNVSADGVSFILYDKFKEPFVRPNKVFIRSTGKNEPLDKLLYEKINDEILSWFNNGMNDSPIRPQSTEETIAWIDDILEPDKQFGPIAKSIRTHGLFYLIIHTEIIFFLFGLDAARKPFAFVINGTKEDIELNGYIIVEEMERIPTLTTSIQRKKYKIILGENHVDQPALLYWGISKEKFPIDNVNKMKINELQDAESLETLANRDDSLRGLIWFDQANSFIIPEEWNEKEDQISSFYNKVISSDKKDRTNSSSDEKSGVHPIKNGSSSILKLNESRSTPRIPDQTNLPDKPTRLPDKPTRLPDKPTRLPDKPKRLPNSNTQELSQIKYYSKDSYHHKKNKQNRKK